MKILAPIYPYTNAGFPMSRSVGGLFTATCRQVDVLLDAKHDVTILVPKNFPVTDKRVKVLRYDCPTKEECGQIKWTPFTEAIADNCEGFDRVLLNNTELATKNPRIRAKLEPHRHKMRIVQHHTDNRVFAAFFAVGYQNMHWIIQGGGRAIAVSKKFDEFTRTTFEKKPNVLSSNPHTCPDLPTDYCDKIEWLNQVLYMFDHEREITEKQDYMMLARFDPEKKIDLGVKSFLASGVKGVLDLYVASPIVRTKKSIEEWENFKSTNWGENVRLHIDAKRGDIIQALHDSAILIFPSGNEAQPLVPMEAASAGCRVIHKCPYAFYLTDYDYEAERLNLKHFTKAIRDCPIPTLEDRKARRDEIKVQGSPAGFASRLEDFLR